MTIKRGIPTSQLNEDETSMPFLPQPLPRAHSPLATRTPFFQNSGYHKSGTRQEPVLRTREIKGAVQASLHVDPAWQRPLNPMLAAPSLSAYQPHGGLALHASRDTSSSHPNLLSHAGENQKPRPCSLRRSHHRRQAAATGLSRLPRSSHQESYLP